MVTTAHTPTYLVLGPVAVRDPGGGLAPLGGAQRRAVLAQLTLAAPRTISTETISTGLWGDHPPPTALKSIQVHVSRLRRVLPAGTLVTRPPGYALEVDPVATDVVTFERLAARGRAALDEGRPDVAAETLREALALWRGDALADVGDHPFAAAAVARLEEARHQVIDDRIAAELATGAGAALVGELESLLLDDPLRERRWALLMTALYRSGRQADALEAYNRARRHLVDELGLEPGPELRDLERQVLDQSLPLPGGARTGPAAGAPTSAAGLRAAHRAIRPLGPSSMPVVGRAEPLAALSRALDAATGPAGTTVVGVVGDEGLGKTRLLAEFAAANADRARIVAGRCREHLQVPFGPWAEILRQIDGDDELELLEGATVDESPERRRYRLFEAVSHRLEAVASDGPLAVVLDDLHWSDDATITLLLHVLSELTSSTVLVLAAWRGREISVGHPVTRLTHHLARTGATSLDLGPLGRADIAELLTLTGTSDEPGARRAAARILEVTGGVPLFVAEAVDTLEAGDDALDVLAEADLALPEIVHTLVGRRLAQAGASAAVVAEACATVADPFTADVVGALVPEMPLDEVVEALDALVTVGLLVDGPAGATFQHGAYRRAIDEGLRSGRRQMLHAAAFRALRDQAVAPAVVAGHSEAAGPLVAGAEVIRHLQAAGDDAASRGAFLDAAGFYERAAARATGRERDRTLVTLADARWRAGDISGAKAVAAEVVGNRLAPGAPADDGDDPVLAEAVVLHGTFGAGYGIDPSSIDAAESALTVVRDPESRARLQIARAYHHAMWGSPLPVALSAVDDANAQLPEPCPPALLGEAMFAESLAALGTPDLARRAHLADELVELGRRSGSPREIGRGLRMRALVEMSAGRLTDLERTLDELVGVAETTGSWLYRSDAWRWRIAASLARGDGDRAAADLDELERVSATPLAGRAFVGTQRLLLNLARGELDPCLAMLDGLRAALPDDPAKAPDRRLADLFRLVVLVEMGRRDEATEELASLRPVRDLDLASCRRYPAELVLTAQLTADLGTPDEAAALVGRVRPFGGQMIVLSWGEGLLGAADRYLGLLVARAEGRIDGTPFDEALRLERGSGAVVEAERTVVARDRIAAAVAP